MHRLFAVLVLLVSAPTLFAQTAATAVDAGPVRWKFQAGKSIGVKMQQTMEQTMVMLGKEQKTSNDTTTYMTWTIKNVDATGNATLATVTDRVISTMQVPQVPGKVVADTDKAEDPPGPASQMMKVFRPMIGVEITQTMSPLGKISDVQIPTKISQALNSAFPGGEGMDEMIKSMTEKASPSFPAANLKRGQSWTTESETKSPAGVLIVKNTYTYDGVKSIQGKNLHTIGIRMELGFKEGSSPNGMTIKIGEQNTTGTLYFDGVAGRLVGSNVNQNVNMDIHAAGKKMAQQIIKSSTKVLFKDLN